MVLLRCNSTEETFIYKSVSEICDESLSVAYLLPTLIICFICPGIILSFLYHSMRTLVRFDRRFNMNSTVFTTQTIMAKSKHKHIQS